MDNERPIEKLLRHYAKKRRSDAGEPLAMHPAMRRLLQGEVARQFARPRAAGFSLAGFLARWRPGVPLLGHEGSFREFVGVNAVYDARAFIFGGGEIGPHTLLRFYILHCVFFPLLTTVFLIVHFWRIRRDVLSGPPL